MKKGKQKIRECVYCGELKEVTKDHVIPTCLFIKPYPLNLITVKACNDCNKAKSLNDDYLRDFLVGDNWVSQNPNTRKLFEKMVSSHRQGKSVIGRDSENKAKLEPFHTKGGIYLGHYYFIPINSERIETTFKTILCGLFYDAKRKRIPDNYIFKLKRIQLWDFDKVWKIFSQHNPNIRNLGETFSYAFIQPSEDSLSSAWLLWFYGQIVFYVSAVNPNLIDKMKSINN